jgi:hypothetical protein
MDAVAAAADGLQPDQVLPLGLGSPVSRGVDDRGALGLRVHLMRRTHDLCETIPRRRVQGHAGQGELPSREPGDLDTGGSESPAR